MVIRISTEVEVEVGFGQSYAFFSARHQFDTWTLAFQETGVWRDRVGVGVRRVLNQRVRVIFQQSFSVLLRHTDELQ